MHFANITWAPYKHSQEISFQECTQGFAYKYFHCKWHLWSVELEILSKGSKQDGFCFTILTVNTGCEINFLGWSPSVATKLVTQVAIGNF